MPIQTAGERQLATRHVTLLQLSWTEPGAPGVLVLELKLEDEGREYVLQAAPDDAAVLLEFLARSREVRFDLGPRSTGAESWLPPARPSPTSGWAEASRMRT